MESTIIENEMLDELADFIGRRPEVSEITRRAMNGELEFTAALEARIALLSGLPDRVLEEAAGRIRLRAGARQLIATMRSAGAVTALVSSRLYGFCRSRCRATRVRSRRRQPARSDRRPHRRHGASADRDRGEEAGNIVALAADMPFHCRTRWPSATAPTICRCWQPPVSASPFTPTLRRRERRWRLDYADLTGLLYAQAIDGTNRAEIQGRGRSPASPLKRVGWVGEGSGGVLYP